MSIHYSDPKIKVLYDWAQAHGLSGLFRKIVNDKAVDMENLDEVLNETWFRYFTHYAFEYIPEAFGILKKLERFDVRSVGLKKVPESIGELKRLNDFTCMDNALTELPDSICRCSNLRYFDVRSNHLKKLPENIGYLTHLEMLIAYGNRLTILPKSIGELQKLHTLDIHDNPIAELPEALKQCTSLVNLDITGTLITHLPEWLGEMKNLKILKCGPSISQIWSETYKTPFVEIDNLPFKLYFEKALEYEEYGPLKIAFRKILDQELGDEEIKHRQKTLIGDEGWPMGNYIWGNDKNRGEYIEYYLQSRWGDSHGKIYKDGSHEKLDALWQTGPIDERYEKIDSELRKKGLIS